MANDSFGAFEGEDWFCNYKLGGTISLALLEIFTFLVGQPVVAKLLWVSYTSKKPTDILNCNLALFHNLQYLVCMFHGIAMFVWPIGNMKILNVLLVYAQTGGPMGLSFISLERYVAVIHPTSYPLLKKYRFREAGSVAVWLSSVITSIAVCIPKKHISPSSDSLRKTLPLVVMLAMTEMMVLCSVSIARVLRTSGPGSDTLHPVKRRAFITICATTAINMFCYIPVASMQRSDLQNITKVKCVTTPFSILLLSAASVVHPLFYLHTQGKLVIC